MRKLQTPPNIVGKTFNRLTILEDLGVRAKSRYAKARCICGEVIQTRYNSIKSGHTTSCGCYNRDVLRLQKNGLIHGLTRTPLYSVWAGMKRRCYNPNDKFYSEYGGRGITVCDAWLHSPEVFVAWGQSNGYSKGLHIDRIDNDKGYSPDNCRFVTPTVNVRNRRVVPLYEYNGESKSLAEWGEMYGFTPQKLCNE
jgi:hypothetical protein